MYQLQTIDDLHQQQHTLGLYCVACNRWADADLGNLVKAGQGTRVLADTNFRCEACDSPAEKQVRPPVPQLGGVVGYVEFRR